MKRGYQKLFNALKKEKVETWFDMNLLLDRMRDNRTTIEWPSTYKKFKNNLGPGIGFVTFDFGIDGVSIEITKYARAFEKLLSDRRMPVKIHCIGGHFWKEAETILDSHWYKKPLIFSNGFTAWDGYNEYFHTALARGSKEYNALAAKLWDQTEEIALELGRYVEENDIGLLFPVNACSNPGNVSLAFALALVSEYMHVPVMGSHHDFYWEDGARERDCKKPGLRDHFFKNSHIGEVFSLIENLYPWDSPLWTHTTINSLQKSIMISRFGHNPISIKRLPTSISMKQYRMLEPNERASTLERLGIVLSNGEKSLTSASVFNVKKSPEMVGTDGKPILLGNSEGTKVNLKRANLLLLQPTRVIRRKRIELDFVLIESLLKHESFKHFFEDHPQLTITILVTGPIANGNKPYFDFLLDEFAKSLEMIPEEFRDRIFLAFPFGLENKEVLRERNLADLKIEEIYGISALTLLPSKTEGRGLPLIESAASGVPVFCNRYEPEHVYSDVIGEMLEESKRLSVFEFKNDEYTEELLERISQIFIDPNSLKELSEHNREVVKKRYSSSYLRKSIDKAIYRLWKRGVVEKKVLDNVKEAFKQHKKVTKYDDKFAELVSCSNRKYIPGITMVEFMVYLKSLIDPSFFRVEETELRSRLMDFGNHLLKLYFGDTKAEKDEKKVFFKHIDQMFEYYRGNDLLAIDHSLSYRHRNRRHYPYRKLTEQELMGLIGVFFRNVFSCELTPHMKHRKLGYFKDLRSSICELIGVTSKKIKIDFSKRLLEDLKSNRPMAFFPGHYYQSEVEIFVLNVLKERLGFSIDHELSKEDLESVNLNEIAPIYLFVREHPLNDISYKMFMNWLEKSALKEIRLLHIAGLFKVVKTKNLSAGLHLGQLGKEGTNALLEIKNNDGFIIANSQTSFMLDMVDMPSYRIGRVKTQIIASYMDLKIGDGFIQWVPAGLKPSLAYPTPIQTPREFSEILKSDLYNNAVTRFGEAKVLEVLQKDAAEFGNPIKVVLNELLASDKGMDNSAVFATQINGLFDDGLPWSGAMARISVGKANWKFVTASSGHDAKTVLALIEQYQNSTSEKVSFAWNGGYILNNELVGKLGLPEDYIGSPLGYLCKEGKVCSLPLYNKSAFLIDTNGKLSMKRINLNKGLNVTLPGGTRWELDGKCRNKAKSKGPIFYDLLYEKDSVHGKGRAIYRFVGTKIAEVLRDPGTDVKILPVGLTLSIPMEMDDPSLKAGMELDFEIPELSNVIDAIEAGPMLVDNSAVAIDMEIEGWKTENSIATQAARLDYLDMRGPKMGVGITGEGDLILIAINGRIRESVGATHIDIANILKEHGATSAMGFDPGGSVTLVVDGQQLNISPYNKDYEENIYTLPPTPRTVGNAILGIK